MAKLNAAARNALPASQFGQPAKRAYPMPDASHAANAKARATQQVKAGNLSTTQEAAIDRKANKMLGEGTPKEEAVDRKMNGGMGEGMPMPGGHTHMDARHVPAHAKHAPGSRGKGY